MKSRSWLWRCRSTMATAVPPIRAQSRPSRAAARRGHAAIMLSLRTVAVVLDGGQVSASMVAAISSGASELGSG